MCERGGERGRTSNRETLEIHLDKREIHIPLFGSSQRTPDFVALSDEHAALRPSAAGSIELARAVDLVAVELLAVVPGVREL